MKIVALLILSIVFSAGIVAGRNTSKKAPASTHEETIKTDSTALEAADFKPAGEFDMYHLFGAELAGHKYVVMVNDGTKQAIIHSSACACGKGAK